MALTSTLYTGLSGLDVNQARLNVVGNNIANVNTVAFKSSRVEFKPQFYVTDDAGTPASGNFGGTNPSQRGLGADVAAIQKDFSPGTIDVTGKSTDMAVDGNGFFVVNSSDGQEYTRDGTFSLNSNNELVTSSGAFVQGYGVDSQFSVIQGSLQNVKIPIGSLTIAQATKNASMSGNLDASGAVATVGSFSQSAALSATDGTTPSGTTLLTSLSNPSAPTTPVIAAGDTFTAAMKKGANGGRDLPSTTFTVTPTSTLQDLETFLTSASGVNTDPSIAGGAGVALAPAAGDPANTVRLQITGNPGEENSLSITGSSVLSSNAANPNPFNFNTTRAADGDSWHSQIQAYDSLGTPVTLDVTQVLVGKSNNGTSWQYYVTSPDNQGGSQVPAAGSTGTVTFGNDGKLIGGSPASLVINRSGTGANPAQTISLDFSKEESLANFPSNTTTAQDGFKFGTLNSFSVGADGTITGTFDNGLTRPLGQIAIATFKNPEGLNDKGGNMFAGGPDSGAPTIGAPTTNGAGAVRSGALEGSNVDISKEFINLIVSSTGFSASSRVISTSDQLLNDLLNSTR
jgi:flagellar hook protein FlgE